MDYGIEVYTDNGNLIFSSAWGHARIMGLYVIPTNSGSYKVPSLDGSPVQKVFAYAVPFTEFYGDAQRVSWAIWTVGDTIYWENCVAGATLAYGDGYK